MNEEEREKYQLFLIAFRHLMTDKKVMSQAELSKLCPGISPPHISVALNHGKGLSEGRQRKIANALSYDYDDFLKLGRSLIDNAKPQQPVDMPPAPQRSESRQVPQLLDNGIDYLSLAPDDMKWILRADFDDSMVHLLVRLIKRILKQNKSNAQSLKLVINGIIESLK